MDEPTLRYEKIDFLGEGQFATVYKARDVKTDKIVAVKKIKIGSRTEAADGINRTALREIKLLQELQHINLIGLLDVFGQKSNVSLVFDFMDTDLEIIVKDNNIVLTPANVKAYMIMTLRGLEYLHQNWILHRDLKPNNLLINREELLFGARQYGTGVDMWAVGCILAELLLRVPFLPGESDLDQLSRIFQVFGTPSEDEWPGMKTLTDYVQFKQFPAQPLRHIFSAASDDLIQLLESLLTLFPPRRCDCTQALQMSYFSNKPAPTVGAKLPMPTCITKTEVPEKPSLKRKLLDNIDGGSLAKKLQF
ncbi:protein kinase domain-containing protein [Phthorimaea operculella]|nr:protein kinase domain-containing protein [Phthorimaea operculella]